MIKNCHKFAHFFKASLRGGQSPHSFVILLCKEEAIMEVDMFFDLCKCLSLCSIYVLQ